MAFNFNDPKKVKEARLKAIADGYDPAEVDAFIKQKQQSSQSIEAVKSGNLNIDQLPQEERAGVATALSQMGINLGDMEKSTQLKGVGDLVSTLRQDVQNLNPLSMIFDRAGIRSFERTKGLANKSIAKLQEEGKLSDADVQMLSDVLKIKAIGPQETTPEEFDRLLQDLSNVTGQQIPGQRTTEEIQGSQKSVEGFAHNAGQDVQGLIEGVLAIPDVAMSVAKNPSSVPQILGSVLEETIKGYGELLTHPIDTFYNRPITATLDVLPFLQIGKAKIAGTIAKTGEAGKSVEVASKVGLLDDTSRVLANAEDVAKTANKSKVKVLVDVADDVAKQADEATKLGDVQKAETLRNSITAVAKDVKGSLKSNEIAAEVYKSAFTVPTKRADKLKTTEVAKKMVDYDIYGNFEKLEGITNQVTGSDGVLTKATRNTIGNVPMELDYGDVLTAVDQQLKNSFEIKDSKTGQIIKTQVNQAIKPGNGPLKVNALDAFDAQKRLEKLAAAEYAKDTYLTSNPEAVARAKVYEAASDELGSIISKAVDQQNLVEGIKTPETIAQLQQISPKLAEEFMQAKTIGDLRRLQSPFVRLNQMIALTNASSGSTFSQVAARLGIGQQAMSRATATLAGAAGGSAFGPLGFLLGGMGGAFLEPAISPTVGAISQAVRPAIATNTAKGIKNLGQMLGGV